MFQKTRRRGIVAAAACTSALALVLSGCGVDSVPAADGTTTPNQTAGGSETTGAAGAISGEITFATWWAYTDQSIVDGFKEQYPDVTVNLEFTAIDGYPTKIQALASSGDLPDVFGAAGATTFSALITADQLLDLGPALDSEPFDGDAATWGGSFVPAHLQEANANTSVNPDAPELAGVPLNALSVASIYNTEIFDEVGISVPETFDALLDNCRALDAAGYIPMSLTGGVWLAWWPYLAWDQTMQGKSPDDFDPADPDFIRGYELVAEMAEAGCWDPSQITTDIAAETSLFLQKRTAQFVSVPENFLQSVVEGATFEVDTYPLPALNGQEPARVMGGGGGNIVVVAKDSENPDAAIAFAKYLTSEQVQSKLAKEVFTIPSIQLDLASEDPIMQGFMDAASGGFVKTADYLPLFTTAGTTTWKTEILPRLVLGEITPEEAAAQTAPLFQ